MNTLQHPPSRRLKELLVLAIAAAAAATSGFAQSQVNSATLADLVQSGGTLSIDDKVFSGFNYQASGLTSFAADNILVTASQSGGIDYLTWSGNISFVSGGFGTADLLLNYIVTASAGRIDLIDQAYTGSAQSGMLAVDETAALGSFGGTVAGYSHLQVGDYSDPPAEAFDYLNIDPSQSVLYVTKDIGLAVVSSSGGFITISQVAQSFHQIPEPGSIGTTLLGLLLLALDRAARRLNRGE